MKRYITLLAAIFLSFLPFVLAYLIERNEIKIVLGYEEIFLMIIAGSIATSGYIIQIISKRSDATKFAVFTISAILHFLTIYLTFFYYATGRI